MKKCAVDQHIQNNGKLVALYCFIFPFISFLVKGIWSIDACRSGVVSRRISNQRMKKRTGRYLK
jgi:hypothetical protein